MSSAVKGNPAVVGLAGFGGTTLLLQFNNLGWCGPGPVLWTALFFGGLAQLIAGLQEFETGNNFGILNITGTDIGWFLVMFTMITAIFLLGSLKISAMLAFTFITLLAGFIFLDISHLGGPAVYTTVAVVDLIICALSAWYLMAHNVFAQLGWNLPVGKPWIK